MDIPLEESKPLKGIRPLGHWRMDKLAYFSVQKHYIFHPWKKRRHSISCMASICSAVCEWCKTCITIYVFHGPKHPTRIQLTKTSSIKNIEEKHFKVHRDLLVIPWMYTGCTKAFPNHTERVTEDFRVQPWKSALGMVFFWILAKTDLCLWQR